ncbi:MAG: hypothetical protein HY094_01295 [Candidatus Melainabacteria bacterium]|nr:hypothetical protein [Candidatus Melainabacteria bacterium]
MLFAIVVGVFHSYLLRSYIEGDGIPYLDIGDLVFQGRWEALVNGIWSPLYAIVQGLFLFLFKPSYQMESTIVHFANFSIYMLSFLAFDFFLSQFIVSYKKNNLHSIKDNSYLLSEETLTLIGYSLFIWSSMNMLHTSRITPDVFVTAFIYLAFGILLRINSGSLNLANFIMLGVVLGLGYFTKEVFFLMAFIFLFAGFVSVYKSKAGLLKMIVALFTFVVISSPLIIALSKEKGYFTFGETGKLNYHWYINPNPCNYIHRGFPGCKKLVHPVREIYDEPRLIEYSYPLPVTYPLIHDPSYWSEGTTPYFDIKGQIIALVKNIRELFKLFLYDQNVLIVLFLILFFLQERKVEFFREARRKWLLFIPAVIPVLIYLLVHLESRYIGAFLVVFWLVLFSSVKLKYFSNVKRVTSLLAVVLVFSLNIMSVFSKDLEENYQAAKDEIIDWQIAEKLEKAGIKKRDKVAIIGNYYDHLYWARLLKVQIIAEIFDEPVYEFWAASDHVKSQVFKTLKQYGIKTVVTEKIPSYASNAKWENINGTSYYFYKLQ